MAARNIRELVQQVQAGREEPVVREDGSIESLSDAERNASTEMQTTGQAVPRARVKSATFGGGFGAVSGEVGVHAHGCKS